ncbi:MAG: hypothetical protein V2A73_22675 [Pseudomonadota bacterium]
MSRAVLALVLMSAAVSAIVLAATEACVPGLGSLPSLLALGVILLGASWRR